MTSLVKAGVKGTIDELRHTETLFPRPRRKPAVPPFVKYNLPFRGNTILLVIPIDDEDKVGTLNA